MIVQNYSILAKPWILLYTYAVVSLLINVTVDVSLPPPLTLCLSPRLIRFWWQASHYQHGLPIIIFGNL